MDVNVGRLQEVVDKGLCLICSDAQAIYAITSGTRGHKIHKIGQVNQSDKIVGDIVFSIPCFLKLSLSPPFLSAKDLIANINLI